MNKLIPAKGPIIFISTILIVSCLIIMVVINSKAQTETFWNSQQDKLALITEKCKTEIESWIYLHEVLLNTTSQEIELGWLSTSAESPQRLKSLVELHSELIAAYVAFDDGTFISSDEKMKGISDFLASSIYQAGMDADGKIIFTEPYIDQIQQELIISCLKKTVTVDGTPGVLVFDISLKNLNAMVNRLYSSPTGGAYLVSAKGNVMTYIDETFLPRVEGQDVIFLHADEVLSQVTVLKNIDKYADNDIHIQHINDYDEKEKYEATTTISGTGWVLGVNIPLSDFANAIQKVYANQIHSSLLAVFMSLISIMVGLVFYYNEKAQLMRNNALMEELEEKNKTLKNITDHDFLTGAYNRLYLNHYMKSISNPYCLLMLDIDFFKSVNDTYGHSVGDDVLIAVTKTMQNAVRTDDLVARIGGEEFAVILENLSVDEAYPIAEKIRLAVSDIRINRSLNVTISIGLTCHAPGQNFDEMLKEADEYLYKAKSTGRNRVCTGSLPCGLSD